MPRASAVQHSGGGVRHDHLIRPVNGVYLFISPLWQKGATAQRDHGTAGVRGRSSTMKIYTSTRLLGGL